MVNLYSKRIQIAPVGFEIDRVVIPAKKEKAEKVYLMVHRNRTEDKATKYAAEIQKKLKAAKIETELVYCDWQNIEEITRVARDLILKEAGNEIAINLASGSKNHAIGLDRACMTFRKRDNIHPFYPEAKKWTAFKYPKQQSEGVVEIKQIPIHRIIVPEPELIIALKIIKRDSQDIPMHKGKKGVKKKDLARSLFGNSEKTSLTKLQRNITQKLENTWRAIEIIEVGRTDWISLNSEGRYLRYILNEEETFG
uniref:Uncharacterized protein n=1 Tax=uncultured marine thaumarchaeote AD1000_89_F09 TaxID=1455947 RepID=A0A075G5R7_9ARCH|nr:hypothetical protein [uncultured marine thaumarchaeote AD1000_89_F09]